MAEVVPISFDPNLIDAPKARKAKDKSPREVPLEPPSELPYKPQAVAGSTSKRQTKDSKVIEDGLTRAIAMMGIALSMLNLFDGMVIGENADLLAKSWTKVAENNASVRNALLWFLSGGDIVSALMVTTAVAIPIAANHGMVEADLTDLAKMAGVKIPVLDEEAVGNNGNGSTT